QYKTCIRWPFAEETTIAPVDNRERKSGEIMESGTVPQHFSQVAERSADLSAGDAAVERISGNGCDRSDGGLTQTPARFFPQTRRA
ncbi:MAG: hypothetical protein ACREED_04510, partial [Stellaceae bacterium]